MSLLVLKGTARAYRHYEEPTQRILGDTNLLVTRVVFDRALDLLEGIGGQDLAMPAGPVEGRDRHFLFSGTTGPIQVRDVHHDLNRNAALRDLFDFGALSTRAVTLPALAPEARAPSDADTLLIGAMHRLKHQQSAYCVDGTRYIVSDHFISLQDIHCLTEILRDEEWDRLVGRAHNTGLTGALLAGLEAARDVFRTRVPEHPSATAWPGSMHADHRGFLRSACLNRS